MGVASSYLPPGRPVTLDTTEEAVLPMVRFRLRIVTVDGTAPAPVMPVVRGEGDATGAGSFDRAE